MTEPRTVESISGLSDDPVAVSVVMPVGGVDENLPPSFDALAAQRYEEPWELVVSLNTADEIARAAVDGLLRARPAIRSRLVDSSDVRSAAHARNVGARAAAGQIILFCDGDDLADAGWIGALARALEDHDAVGGHLEEGLLAVPGQDGWRPPATPDALPTFLGHPYLVSANMGLTRAAFDSVGGFDTTLIRGEDIALSWDLTSRNVELAYVADAVIHYRHRKGLRAMMHQHYLYGRGFSQLLARRGTPDGEAGGGLSSLRPNGQPVDAKGPVYYLRRGSIAAGRVVGLVEERAPLRRPGAR